MPNAGRLHVACLAAMALAAVLAWSASAASTRQPRPHRIVSLNLCTDQLVLALADREQVAGLTRNAADADMSAEAPRARGLRILGSSAEEILELEPDLIVGMPARRSPAVGMLAGQSYRLLDLKPANKLEDIFVSIRETAAAVGHPERGDALIAEMRRDLARIPRNGDGKVAVYYQRRGYMTGTGTLVDDLMTHVGLVNLAARLRKPPLAQVSLEEIVAAQPDYLIVESATDRITDQGTEMLHHPALDGIPRLSVPEAWTVCGSPAYVRAARGMTEQMAAIQDGRR